MPPRREGGDGPVCRVEDYIGGCETNLEPYGAIAETNDAEHECQGADEGDDSVGGVAVGVVAFFRVPVELSSYVLVAFDD